MPLQVFVSWSGERSRFLATQLREWLPRVLQSVRTWMSDQDIAAGARWSEVVATQLAQANVGVICVTPENQDAEWLNFEAGALSNSLGESLVCPILFGLSPGELKGPLSQFQATTFDKKGMSKLVGFLNERLNSERVKSDVWQDAFKGNWSKLQKTLEQQHQQLFLRETSIQGVVRALAKSGNAPIIGGTAFFAEGFESHLLYDTVCKLASRRLLVFGRKNRKLFDKEHRAFLKEMKTRVERDQFDFRCLFLDPNALPHVLHSAHQDADFGEQLRRCIEHAKSTLEEAGLPHVNHMRVYRSLRTAASVIVDDAVLVSSIRMSPEGQAMALTKCGFTVTNSKSSLGRDTLDDFESNWTKARAIA